jgi:3D-(3,5/4)-trihydroxycyclohexane-1,2-dione acylhydrolase (decyclizing)
VIYSEASAALAQLAEAAGIPVAETQAGKGALPFDHPLSLGAMGVTGTKGANVTARDADVVIGIGTRYSDFTTASKTAFQHPNLRFININVVELDAYKHRALPLVGDARATISRLQESLGNFSTKREYRHQARQLNSEWNDEVSRIYATAGRDGKLSQGQVIGIVNEVSRPQDVVLCAAGSLPGDLHKLWRTRDPKGYHMEYGYSCMGYEIAGGLGVKMADPQREVYVMVGDGSYLMLAQEIVTAIQEGYKLTIVLINNYGFASIGGLSQAVGAGGFGTHYRYRNEQTGQLDGPQIPVDYVANARSLGAHVIEATNTHQLRTALREASEQTKTTVIVVETDRESRVSGYESWWDVPVAESSTAPDVQAALATYQEGRRRERYFV